MTNKTLTGLLLIGACATCLGQDRPKLILVSIDGLKAETYHQADTPNLRQMRTGGATCEGVNGVLPSITFPNHTSMVTGVSPAVHGIDTNYLYDPEGHLNRAQNWYAERIRVPALWDVAHQAGLRTGAVSWPASFGAAIDYNFPERRLTWNEEDVMLARASGTPGLMKEFEAGYRALRPGETTDEMRTAQAVFLIRNKRPDVLFVHLIDLDHTEHSHGPGSPEARQVLEATDRHLGEIRAAVRAMGEEQRTVWVLVSDHGFRHHHRTLHPGAVLASLGLQPAQGKREAWRVAAQVTGGSFALYLRDAADAAAAAAATQAFRRMRQEGIWGIDQVLDRAALDEWKAFPGAFLAVSLQEPFGAGRNVAGAWITGESGPGGTHGHLPGPRELQSVLTVFGPGIAARNLGVGRVFDVAPTVTGLLGLRMPGNIEGNDLLRGLRH